MSRQQAAPRKQSVREPRHTDPTPAPRRVGRPSAAEPGRDTRADIRDAALTLFADAGFERTSMRAVAASAGVDVALIYHHFGSKEELLDSALSVPAAAEHARRPVPAGTNQPGQAVVRAVLELWEHDPGLRRQAQAIVRTAISNDRATERVRNLHAAYVLDIVAEVVAPDHKQLRAGLIGSQLSGLLLGRHIFHIPSLTGPDIDTLAAAVAPAIDHYLNGKLAQDDPG